MKPPTTFAEWADFLDTLKSCPVKSDILDSLKKGHLELLPGPLERFTSRLTETFHTRLNNAVSRFQKSTRQTNADERVLITALNSLKKELEFIHEMVTIPALPTKYQDLYLETLSKQAKQIQESLQSTAKSDRTGKLSSMIKKFNLQSIVSNPSITSWDDLLNE